MTREILLKFTKSELIELLEKIHTEIESEIWTHHTFGDDNFNMTKIQEDRMNEMVLRAHNTPLQELLKTINNYLLIIK